MPSYKGLPWLQAKLAQKRVRVDLRYLYYEMKQYTVDFGISTPPDLKYWNAVVGWCAKAVDSLADRIQLYDFRDDAFAIGEIYALNNDDVLVDSSILSALIAACSFIYISEDETGFPRMQVIDGGNATGVMNEITGLLDEGYAVLERDELGAPALEAYFTYEGTSYIRGGEVVDYRENKAPFPLLVPIVFRPDARRPFGHSRISRACMSAVASAIRTIKRSEISAEFYSYPQKWVTGVDQNAEQMDKWRASMSSMLKFTLNDDGDDKVKLGQFVQQSMEPHISQLRMFASLFAGETGLTLDDLGFPTENPSSAEAIKAAHENLRLTARKAQRQFGKGLINAGYLAACVRDNRKYLRYQLRNTRVAWEPLFEPDASILSAIGDGMVKINQAVPGYLTNENLRELTGIASEV